MGLIRLKKHIKIETISNCEHILFYLTPTNLYNVEDATSALLKERGGSFSEYWKISWGEVVVRIFE
jgi:hypothetical protein